MGLSNPFKKKTEESTEIEATSENPITPEVVDSLPDNVKEQAIAEFVQRYGLKLNFEKSEERISHEEVVPQVITIGTDLDHEDEITHEIRTKTDKYGFHIDYHGTKGFVFETEAIQLQFGHLAAIIPQLRNHVYVNTYKTDEETGIIERGEDGKPIILKKTRVHLAVELSNLKLRQNLAQDGLARKQQERVIIGGVGQVSPMSEGSMDKAMELMFGRKGK